MYEDEVVQEMTADSLNDIRNRLYKLYGNDYTIVDRKMSLSAGFLGFGRKEQVTVKYIVKERSRPSASDQNNFLFRTAEQQKIDEEEQHLEENRQAILNSQTSTLISAQMQMMDKVQTQIQDMQDSINRKLSSVGSQEKPESISKIEELLEKNEFSFSYISMITDKIRSTFSIEQLKDFDFVERTVVDWIGESIFVAEPQHHRPPHVVIIVGPTGVGKTTTLVKLCARKIIDTRREGGKYDAKLITTDIYRVGAIQQLQSYGNDLKREVLKAESVEDLKILFDENKDHCDAIYIDTSGYSPNDSVHIGQMKAMLDVPGLSPDVYLAFDAKTKCRDIINIMNNYEPFNYGSVIATKCDESGQYGNIISALYEKRKKIAFITDGQNAARNLTPADVVYFLTRLEGFKIDREHINQKFQNSEVC